MSNDEKYWTLFQRQWTAAKSRVHCRESEKDFMIYLSDESHYELISFVCGLRDIVNLSYKSKRRIMKFI